MADLTDMVNDGRAFGFHEAAPQVKKLFRRKSGLRDLLNFHLAKACLHGFHQVEMEGQYGVPMELLQQLDTSDVAALYVGIQMVKGRLIERDEEERIGQPFADLVYHLISCAYDAGNGKGSANALREMHRLRLGFTDHFEAPLTIHQRMENLDEQTKTRFLRAYNTYRLSSQERAGEVCEFWDPVYATHHARNGTAGDSASAREAYIKRFTTLLREKQIRRDDFSEDRFSGMFVSSESTQGREYFVQQNTFPSFTGGEDIVSFSCSCPHGYRRMHGYIVRGDECKHIKSFRTEMIRREWVLKSTEGGEQLPLL